jgi:hypothetical protein
LSDDIVLNFFKMGGGGCGGGNVFPVGDVCLGCAERGADFWIFKHEVDWVEVGGRRDTVGGENIGDFEIGLYMWHCDWDGGFLGFKGGERSDLGGILADCGCVIFCTGEDEIDSRGDSLEDLEDDWAEDNFPRDVLELKSLWKDDLSGGEGVHLRKFRSNICELSIWEKLSWKNECESNK